MDDTSCQIACPTNPKSCIVLNTSKLIPAREVPSRNGQTLMTNVKGIYMVGDISGVPLIKNAINEGAIYKFLTKPWHDDHLRDHVQEAFSRKAAGISSI